MNKAIARVEMCVCVELRDESEDLLQDSAATAAATTHNSHPYIAVSYSHNGKVTINVIHLLLSRLSVVRPPHAARSLLCSGRLPSSSQDGFDYKFHTFWESSD